MYLHQFTTFGYLFCIFLNLRLLVTSCVSSSIYDFWLPLFCIFIHLRFLVTSFLYLPQFTTSGYLFRIFFEYGFRLPLSYLPQFTTSVYPFGIFKHCFMNYTKTPKGPSWQLDLQLPMQSVPFPLMLCIRISIKVRSTTLCDKVCL